MASTFSYAQAAKGIATPAAATKTAPNSLDPIKDGATAATASTWAEDVDTESQSSQNTASQTIRPQSVSTETVKEARSADVSSASSPDLGALSSSTVAKDDDVSSIPNTSSESTWDNKSQASISVDKAAESTEKTSEKVKKGKNAVVKPLQEAPPPAVNPWKMRADEMKAKVSKTPVVNGTSQLPRRSEQTAQEKPAVSDGRNKGREDGSVGRKDARDADTRKNAKGRFSERDVKAGSAVLPPPPNRDQESWPTPETVIDEDRKKAQEKGERADKERKESTPSGKHEWVKVPYTPSVVFNTPLPNAANTRRGGRPGGRGGVQSNGRPTASASNGAGQPEKDISASEPANVELAKQERPDSTPAQEGFSKEKRNGGVIAHGLNGHVSDVNGDVPKFAQPASSESDAQNRRASETSHAPGQNTTYPRQYPNRSNKVRRGDFSGVGDRRRTVENSPTKDNTLGETRSATGTQTDVAGEVDRHDSAIQSAPNGHTSKHGRFTSFSSGRERGRGGRGARASYSNGHQFANGHQSTHSSTFSVGPQSPTTFNPGNSSFFSNTQGKYGRNGHRSQSVTTDAYRYTQYQNGAIGSQLPPYNMYEYSMMQPMSPMPFPYGVDYNALVAVITTQVEYYFSVDNLLKDMYLRRHMDSQGFVTLEFIAGFNRIKNLSADLEMIKYVCQQSAVIEYRVGEDGQDRLRRREGWAQWVLSMGDRDASAQNDGPKELHQPPNPSPAAFEQPKATQWTPMPSAAPFTNGNYSQTNGDSTAAEGSASSATENVAATIDVNSIDPTQA